MSFFSVTLLLCIASVVSATNTTTPFTRLARELSTQSLDVTLPAFSCTNALYDCTNHGYCNREGTACICDKGYATHKCNPTEQCCYTQESRVKLFIIAFFTSWLGVPYFLVGAVGMGVGILMLCCCGFVFAIVGSVWGASKENACGVWMGVIGVFAMIAVFGWHIGVWGQLAAGTEPYNDRNGVPIAPWR